MEISRQHHNLLRNQKFKPRRFGHCFSSVMTQDNMHYSSPLQREGPVVKSICKLKPSVDAWPIKWLEATLTSLNWHHYKRFLSWPIVSRNIYYGNELQVYHAMKSVTYSRGRGGGGMKPPWPTQNELTWRLEMSPGGGGSRAGNDTSSTGWHMEWTFLERRGWDFTISMPP